MAQKQMQLEDCMLQAPFTPACHASLNKVLIYYSARAGRPMRPVHHQSSARGPVFGCSIVLPS